MLDLATSPATTAMTSATDGLERCAGCGHSRRNHGDHAAHGCARPLCDCGEFR
jgi:hypothetical protein